MGIFFGNSVRQERPKYLGPLPANVSGDTNLQECIACPELCVNCIKKICDITNTKLEADNYNLVYVASGEVSLFFPYSNTKEQLAENELLLIPNATKFVMKRGNISAASCVVTHLDSRQISKRAKSNCICKHGKTH